MGLAHSGQTRAPVLAERAHHVEDDARLPRVVEVEPVADGDVEEIVVGESPVRGILDVV